MQKTSKRLFSQSKSHRFAVPLPEVISTDELGAMLDDDLLARLRALEEDRSRAVEGGADPRKWEEEAAYVRREQQLRRHRRDAHSEYVRAVDEEFNRTEASLSHGDFDNSAFVYAAVGGRPRWN